MTDKPTDPTPKLFQRKGNAVILDRRNSAKDFGGICELCGKQDELRPYGPNNANICFDCGMKNEAETTKRFLEMLEGNDQ